jgi:phenylalanyl-tRNA synthetase beta chain
MKILLSWLREYIDIQETPESIADALLMAGIEVEAIHQPGRQIRQVVAGRILQAASHPNADKLTVCEVDVGKPEPLTIVCGAPNARTAGIVPVALIGAQLPSGMEIRRAKIRGVESFGMMCSAQELGLSDDHSGLYPLPEDTKPGSDVVPILNLDDVVFEISITPNRGDALSHLGIARELSAIFNLPIHRNALDTDDGGESIQGITSVTIEEPQLCPRYGARVVEGVKIGPSPKWLKDRLERIGIRTINNVVDVTNYVMLDIGHPMHAFDFDRLAGRRIVVRQAKAGEPFISLDGIERRLNPPMLVIADAEKPAALGGVMGGRDSEVTNQTVNILLEAASFDPTGIRKTAKVLTMASESSYRFERGTNIDNVPIALNLAVRLILETAGGTARKGVVDAYPAPEPLRRILLRPRRASQLIGVELKAPQIETILLRLKLEVTREGENLWVGIPPYRHDLETETDLIEETARIYGYANIPTTLPAISSVIRPPAPLQTMEQRFLAHLVSLGFNQIITYSFIPNSTSELLQEGIPLRLQNPLSEEQGILRTSLIPGMFDALRRNILEDEFDLRLFEIGRIYQRGAGDLPRESVRLGIGVVGRENPSSWRHNSERFDLFTLKGVISSLAKLRGFELNFQPGNRQAFHPVHQWEVHCNGHLLGHLGRIHPKLIDNKKIPEDLLLAELDLEILAEQKVPVPRMKPIPAFPAIRRDLALEVPVKVTQEEILIIIRKEGGQLLEHSRVFDVYQGKGVEPGHRSLAWELTFRSPERTLTDEEIQPIMNAIVEQATAKFQTRLR